MKYITLTLLVVGLAIGVAAGSEVTVLEDAFHVHSNMYNDQADRFMEVRDREDAALARYTSAIRALDQAIADNTVLIEGTWQATELGKGNAITGVWTARKLAPGEDAGL